MCFSLQKWERLGKSNVYSVVVGDWIGVITEIIGEDEECFVHKVSESVSEWGKDEDLVKCCNL